MAQTIEGCESFRKNIVEMIEVNNDLTVIKSFINQFQVDGYSAYKVSENAKLKIANQKLMIEKGWKSLTKIATIISTIAGAVATVMGMFF